MYLEVLVNNGNRALKKGFVNENSLKQLGTISSEMLLKHVDMGHAAIVSDMTPGQRGVVRIVFEWWSISPRTHTVTQQMMVMRPALVPARPGHNLCNCFSTGATENITVQTQVHLESCEISDVSIMEDLRSSNCKVFKVNLDFVSLNILEWCFCFLFHIEFTEFHSSASSDDHERR